jgi:hypothetical protein
MMGLVLQFEHLRQSGPSQLHRLLCFNPRPRMEGESRVASLKGTSFNPRLVQRTNKALTLKEICTLVVHARRMKHA